MEKKQFLILLGALSAAFFIGGFFGVGAYLNHITHSSKLAAITDNTIQTAMAENQDAFVDVDKMMAEQQKAFSDFNKSFFSANTKNAKNSGFIFFENGSTNSSTIKTEEYKDFYKITVNLKPFNNDEKNVKVKVSKNRVTISAKSKMKNNSSSIYQSFTLPTKANVKMVRQIKKGNDLVITIPKC